MIRSSVPLSSETSGIAGSPTMSIQTPKHERWLAQILLSCAPPTVPYVGQWLQSRPEMLHQLIGR